MYRFINQFNVKESYIESIELNKLPGQTFPTWKPPEQNVQQKMSRVLQMD